jgi:6-pyruvoyl-tetrahydropterin synthase
MKHTVRKLRTLTVKRETLRQLDHRLLNDVAGGGVEEPPSNSLCGSHCLGAACVQK